MRKPVRLIPVPFDSAHFNQRMGAGLLFIMNSGVRQQLETIGFEVNTSEIVLKERFPTEIASTFHLLKLLKDEIQETTRNQSFPIVLSGNCCATVAVMDTANTGIMWFDAHGDCETPETTISGFLDGMGLSMVINECWQNLLSSFQLNTSLTGKNIVLAGARDLSASERQFISIHKINPITVEEIKHSNDAIKAACSQLIRTGIQRLHLHIDVDVVDPSVAPANSYAVVNGLGREDLVEAVQACISEIPPASVTIASYDPSFDTDRRMPEIINKLIETIAGQIL